MKFFDCYAHLGLISSDHIERFRVVQEAKHAGLTHIINVSNNLQEFETFYESAKLLPQIYYAVGFAPSEAHTLPNNWQLQLEKAFSLNNVLCLGAIGLDYSNNISAANKMKQIELFVKQLEIARRLNKPAIIYNRNASQDIKNILRENAPQAGIIFHCYSETAYYATQILKDFSVPTFFAFAGNLTFRNSRDLHRTVLKLPLENILVESVSPFMPPALFNGTRNVPANIFATVEFISELLNEDFERVGAQLYKNALRAFGLS